MKLIHCLRKRLTIPKFVVVVFLCLFTLSFCFHEAQAEHWDGCECPHPLSGEPQSWTFTGDMNCNNIHFVWCANCEHNIAGYLIEYKIVPNEPTGIIGPDDYNNMWTGTGLDQGGSPIMMWNPGKKPEGVEYENDLVLTDKDKPEIVLSGAEDGKYYVFALRAVDNHNFKSDHSDENSGLAVCGPAAITDLIIKF